MLTKPLFLLNDMVVHAQKKPRHIQRTTEHI